VTVTEKAEPAVAVDGAETVSALVVAGLMVNEELVAATRLPLVAPNV
jgi:hypothetical protein